MFRSTGFAVVLLALLAQAPSATGAPQTHYHVVSRFVVGGEGGWDALTADPESRRLYLSHGTRVEVLNLDDGHVLGSIDSTPGVHGIALAPDLGRGFTSNGRDSSVTVFDLKSLATITRVQLSSRVPDAIVYDPVTHRVFSFNGGSANATAIDGASASIVGSVDLGGRPEFAVTDGKGRMFVNIEDRNEVVAFDTRTLKIAAHWPLVGGEGPSGIALDRKHRRLFSGCDNHKMIVLDADRGSVVATLPIGEGVDGVAFDPGTRLAFSSNGEGSLTVVREDAPNRFAVAENDSTQRGARTLALDEKTHRVFVVTAEFGPPPPPTAERPHPRASIVPGTFQVLVLSR